MSARRSDDTGHRPVPAPASTRASSRQAARLVVPLWILAVLAMLLWLREMREVFVPVALAVLASYPLQPPTDWLHRRMNIPRSVAAGIVVGLVIGSVGWVGWSLREESDRAMRQVPEQMRQLRQRVVAQADGGALDRIRRAMREMQQTAQTASETAGVSPAGTSSSAESQGAATSPLDAYLWRGSASLLALAGQVVVIVFLVYFLLLGAPAWRARLISLSGNILSSRRTGAEVLHDIAWQVQRFLLVRLGTSAGVALATWLALLWLGAPAPAFWGLAAGVFNSVPYFGPLIVSTGLALVGLVSGGFTLAAEMAGIALLITTLEGWLITPPLLGRAAKMNTLAVFIGLLVWSWTWGVWGTILAVPLLAMIKAVADHVESLAWLARLLDQDAPPTVHGTGSR